MIIHAAGSAEMTATITGCLPRKPAMSNRPRQLFTMSAGAKVSRTAGETQYCAAGQITLPSLLTLDHLLHKGLPHCTTESVDVGIIQNQDDAITTIYDFGSIQELDKKQRFLELANIWWWESNRSIPINIFLKSEWELFRPYVRTFTNKDLEVLHGPVCSLSEISRRKSKRKSITLVRRVD